MGLPREKKIRIVQEILACLVCCLFPTWMRFVKRLFQLSFCSNGLFRKETGNLDESLGFTGYLCSIYPVFDVFLSTSVYCSPHFGWNLWKYHFAPPNPNPTAFYLLAWKAPLQKGGAQNLKLNEETESQKARICHFLLMLIPSLNNANLSQAKYDLQVFFHQSTPSSSENE